MMENKLPDSEVNFLTAKAELFAFKTFGLASNCTIVTTESLPDQLRTSPDTLDSSKIMGMVQLPTPRAGPEAYASCPRASEPITCQPAPW